MIRTGFILFVLLLAPLSGCLSQHSITDECVITTSSDDKTLTIVTYDIIALSDEVLEEFTNQTGYNIEMIRTDDAGGILEQLLLTKEAPQADLALGLDNTYLQTALDNCLLAPHSASLPNLDPDALVPYAGNMAVPFDQGYVCLNVDTQALGDNNVSYPTTLEELTNEAWKGRTAFPSPTTSSPGRAFMTATIDYFEQQSTMDAMEWWEAMANNDAIFTSGWTEAYETHYSGGYGVWGEGHIGDAWLTVSYCHSPGVEAYYGGNYTISSAIDIDLATDPPTLKQGPRPGPWLNAIASTSSLLAPQLSIAVLRRSPADCTWWSAASLGWIPPSSGRYNDDEDGSTSDPSLDTAPKENVWAVLSMPMISPTARGTGS